ncbi:hypothetical protein J6590_032247 [Homalodisca vitripennis]|nr:hypothetical protein J6590_032247 [Homalodisca vitripennis]
MLRVPLACCLCRSRIRVPHCYYVNPPLLGLPVIPHSVPSPYRHFTISMLHTYNHFTGSTCIPRGTNYTQVKYLVLAVSAAAGSAFPIVTYVNPPLLRLPVIPHSVPSPYRYFTISMLHTYNHFTGSTCIPRGTIRRLSISCLLSLPQPDPRSPLLRIRIRVPHCYVCKSAATGPTGDPSLCAISIPLFYNFNAAYLQPFYRIYLYTTGNYTQVKYLVLAVSAAAGSAFPIVTYVNPPLLSDPSLCAISIPLFYNFNAAYLQPFYRIYLYTTGNYTQVKYLVLAVSAAAGSAFPIVTYVNPPLLGLPVIPHSVPSPYRYFTISMLHTYNHFTGSTCIPRGIIRRLSISCLLSLPQPDPRSPLLRM